MVRIISLSNPRLAQAFVDYMATQSVRLDLQAQDQNVSLWLPDESRLSYVEQELKRFLQEPMHPRYQAASWHTGTTHSGLYYAHFNYLKSVTRQAGPLTITITALCIVVYLLQTGAGDDTIMRYLSWPETGMQYFQLWRYFTPALLHFSPLHIIFNLMWWWYLGGQVEKRLGAGKLVQIALVSTLMSGWAQSLFSGSNFGGLSGVIYALMAYVWWCGERAPQFAIGVPRGLLIFFVLWLLVGYFDWFSLSIANAAHAGGLVIGLLMALWDFRHFHRQQ